jgi:succinylglutamate desuccinylase
MQKRVIARYTENRKGPLLVVLSAMHGNEHSGVTAIESVYKSLQEEHKVNDAFTYKGCFLGLIGNLKAFTAGKRFIEKDINRQFFATHVEKIKSSNSSSLEHEDLEMKELLETIDKELSTGEYTKLIVLDLHTTSSEGGIFTIPNEEPESLQIALGLHAPVITGMLKGIQGTTLHYFNNKNFDINTTSVTFESGQHNDSMSSNRAIAALINCMRTIGAVDPTIVENKHDELLLKYSSPLPKCSILVERHPVSATDQFKMKPNYKNFQAIKKGEILATDIKGNICSPYDGMILMPLYQEQGEDGFFIIQESEIYTHA